MKILLASNNPKKAHELRTILANSGIEILTLADVPHYDEPIEDGRTFADNALIKARAGAQHTGLVTIADDSVARVCSRRVGLGSTATTRPIIFSY